jgi:hemerythrin-like metal-binding protein
MSYEALTWKDDYSSGNESIDHQNKTIITILNDLIGTYNTFDGDPNTVLVEVPIDELFKFAAQHFPNQEEILKSKNSPELIDHHLKHVDFIIQLTQLKVRLDKEENISKELIEFIINWLNNHVSIEDKKVMQLSQ